jgi:nitrate reductase NapA
MWEEFCTDGGAIDTIWVQVTNPGQTLPHQNKLFLAKKERKGKFLIVSDVYPTATTALADLVLPSAMYVEKNGMYGNAERKQQQWFKMVEPPGQARPDAWQVLAVAKAMFDRGFPGMKDKDGEWIFAKALKKAGRQELIPAWDFAHYYDVNVDERMFEEYRPFTKLKHKDLAPYAVYAKAHGLRWPVVEKTPGNWEETLVALRRGQGSLRQARHRPAVLPLEHQGRQGLHLVASVRGGPRSPMPSIRSGCAPAACSSTGIPAP